MYYLILNEETLNQLPEPQRAIYVFEWLRQLEKVLPTTDKADIKTYQSKIVQQLNEQIQSSPGPATRRLVASCLSIVFSVGDTFLLFDTVNACNDVLRNKDDSPNYHSTKLAAVCVLGAMYEKLGRMMGRSYEETVQILLRSLRNAESQTRIEIIITLEKLCIGMGSALSNVLKDIYKATKHYLNDRVMAVRVSSAHCLLEIIKISTFVNQTELESLATLCFRAFEGSNHEVRYAVANLLGELLAHTQHDCKHSENVTNSTQSKNQLRHISLDDILNILMSGFLRGGVSFLKGTGEIIKGTSAVNREVRVGVTHSYVIFAQRMGSVWLERNLFIFLEHVLDLVANPKAASSHVEAVHSRKCIIFILRSVVGRILGEKAQSSACKDLFLIVSKQMNSIDFTPENAKDSNQETLFSQHMLVCALEGLGSLVLGLGTAAQSLLNDQTLNFINTICEVLIHPCVAARLAAAWCLRCLSVAVPSSITTTMELLMNTIAEMRSSPEAIAGYSAALAALLGSIRYSTLGIPHNKGKVIFNFSEELLRSASQNSRMSLQRTQAGWLLIGSIMTLGPTVVKGILPRLLSLWRNSFPRSTKELDSEKSRGNAFTWQITLEGRSGALSVMHSFLENCTSLVNDDIIKRLLITLESALAMLVNLSSVIKSYGTQLNAAVAMVRLRLYETLTLMPPDALECSYTHLLRILVAEFTLSENLANTTNSFLRTLCHGDDSIILGTWLQDVDLSIIEDQLQLNIAASSGALEHDHCYLYRYSGTGNKSNVNKHNINDPNKCPGPLPLGVAVIDMSVILFGQIFPKVANKHRLQMLEHFGECIKQMKGIRQEAVQINIFTALLCGLKGLTDIKSKMGDEDIKKSTTKLILSGLVNGSSLVRYAAGEALGRVAQVVSDSRFTAELAQNFFDKLKSARDVIARTGYSLALGCLHRYVGGMGSSQHLNTSVSILLALGQDTSSPVVQVWSLYALAMTAESVGPMFRGYVEPTLLMCIKLLLIVPHSNVDVHQCVGRVLNALITTVGPELQSDNSISSSMRSSFLSATRIMQVHLDPLVRTEAIGCLQQLHMFSSRYVNLPSIVPVIVKNLSSNYLMLRKAAISCLRQLAQREAKEVCELALKIYPENSSELVFTEYGLPGVLFSMLDYETDYEMIKNLHDTLTSMLQRLAKDNPTFWLSLCKNVLTVSVESEEAANSESSFRISGEKYVSTEDGDGSEDDDDVAEYHADKHPCTHPTVLPRWPTRVFAAQCVRKIVVGFEIEHTTYADIQEKAIQPRKLLHQNLILYVADLIRMAFMAATSDSDQLRLQGLKMLQEIIDQYAQIPEPEFPGHFLLEQFQAQVSAALRPAFSADTPPHVTAAACEVCSAWIGSGVARDLNDLRRVHQLLVSSLNKLRSNTKNMELHNESVATLEKLSILKAWAEVYIVAMIENGTAPVSLLKKKKKSSERTVSAVNVDCVGFGENKNRIDSLLMLVKPEIKILSLHWMAALKDYVLLLLPNEFRSQLPYDVGSFYTNDTINLSKQYYYSSWPPILYASALWLNHEVFGLSDETGSIDNSIPSDWFVLIFGICIEALCSTRSFDKSQNTICCLQSLYTILNCNLAHSILVEDEAITIELCNVLHRQILTHDDLYVQFLCLKVLHQVVQTTKAHLQYQRTSYNENHKSDHSNKMTDLQTQLENLGEGGDSGEIAAESSTVFAALEVCVCVFLRHIPTINSNAARLNVPYFCESKSARKNDQSIYSKSDFGCSYFNEDTSLLLGSGLQCMEHLTALCSPKGALTILPTILFISTSFIREVAKHSSNHRTISSNSSAVQSVMQLLKASCCDQWSTNSQVGENWDKLLQSALASIVDLIKTAPITGDSEFVEYQIDELIMLQVITVFILNTSAAVLSPPPLQYPCINYLRQCLKSNELLVRLKSVQSIRFIFCQTSLNVAIPYINALAPSLIETLYATTALLPTTDLEVNLILETIMAVETLIEIAEPQNRLQLLSVLVQLLLKFSADPFGKPLIPTSKRRLNELSLRWLMKIGRKYPQEFKALMVEATDLRQELEEAIRNQHYLNNDQKPYELSNGQNNEHHAKPTIQLKTNFNNFE